MNRTVLLALVGVLWLGPAVVAAQDVDKLERELKDAINRDNKNDTEEKAKHLSTFNSEPSMKALLSSLSMLVQQPKKNETIYWIVLKAVASFTNEEPLQEAARWILTYKNQPVARDLLFMMQSNYSAAMVYPMITILEKGPDELKVMAIDHMATLGVKEAIPPLVAALKKEGKGDTEVKRRIVKALTVLTGQDYGDSVTNWEGWWEANKDKELKREDKEYKGGLVTTGLDKPRENDLERAKKLPPDLIVVLKGGPHAESEQKRAAGGVDHNNDHIEALLKRMGIPHIEVTKEEFEKSTFKLDGRMALLINCTQWRAHCVCEFCAPTGGPTMRLYTCKCSKTPEVHDTREYKLSDNAVKKIKEFTEKGGYLFTEDWVLEELHIRAWPDLLKVGEYLSDLTVNINPKPGMTSHPYLKRIFAKPPKLVAKGTQVETDFDEIKHQWKIDKDSPTISVVDPKKVQTLLVSKEIGGKHPGDDAVAVTWFPGGKEELQIGTGKVTEIKKMSGGRVLHVLSHFGKQKSEKDEYTLQNLLLNFLLEAVERYSARQQKK